ncbi:hypothetical protein BJF93_17375 [Xaviernesmea oryzae]|uniref:HD-GYP domain-containing protein n=1 Tax=Xaviernesmea oryzae TaxID=464029 RepID=A0A1Q9ATH1_9HYPH|nr:HD-GYP domain-containing protein [Xaviernesmea oryzae]OLP58615.1 hypothetical protein BJF93_17375 [Xaviernesmea oryzae]SEK64251.1 HDIG domain-containing protein [Xaviernesmea oryzae]
MVKRIDKEQVRRGMFVEALEGAWQDNPFPYRRFLLEDDESVEILKGSRITGVFINTALGLDVSGRPAPARMKVQAPPSPANDKARQASAKVISETSQRLEALFDDVTLGNAIAIDHVNRLADNLAASIEQSPTILLDMTRLKSKDKATFLHSLAVSALLMHFARSMSFDSEMVRVLGVAGLLHDIGKLIIPKEVLQKPGSLTSEERQVIMQHPVFGFDLLKASDMPAVVLDICRYHHERMDGRGYPDRLTAEKLSVPVRMAAIVDVYEAITSLRPYRTPWSSQRALTWMSEQTGHFDRQLLMRFVLSLDPALTQGMSL